MGTGAVSEQELHFFFPFEKQKLHSTKEKIIKN